MIKKVTQADLQRMRERGKTVEVKKPAPAKAKPVQDVPMASMSAAIERIASENQKTIRSFAKEVRKVVERKRKPWKFTVNRNKQGTITTVLADPVE